MTISANTTFLVACITETLAYGIALVLFINSMQTLSHKRRTLEPVNKPVMLAAPVLFLFATIHVFGVWTRTLRGFTSYAAGPTAYFGLITSPEKTVTQVGQVGAVILGDAMTLFRAYVIWNSNIWVVIVPGITFIGTVVCGIAFITAQHRVSVTTSIFSTTVTQWTEGWLSTSLVTTGICTLLVVYRLLSSQHRLRAAEVQSSNAGFVQRVVRILVESMAVYSINNLLYAVLYSLKENPEAWFSGLDAPIASITFSLIILRLQAAVRPQQSTTFSGSSSDPETKLGRSNFGGKTAATRVDVSLPRAQLSHSRESVYTGRPEQQSFAVSDDAISPE